MKKLLLAALLLFAISCGKEDKNDNPGTVTFYTLNPNNWALIVDGIQYGKIRNTIQMPVCGDPLFQTMELSAGKHTVDAKSIDGSAWGNPKTVTVISDQCIQVKLP